MRRRSFVGMLGGGAVTILAGCTSVDDGASPTPTQEAATPQPTTTGTAGELDLREANVMAVAFERRDGEVRFDVTLLHDDDGEDGYANWWQVERLDGSTLGRRDLAHPHGTQEFTRSTTVEIPTAVVCVVVRGHDQSHGYGGRVMLVNLDSGATRAVLQGADPGEFSRSDCP